MGKTNIQGFALLVFGILGLFLTIVYVCFAISNYLDREFGSVAVVALWAFVLMILTGLGVWTMALKSFRAGGDLIVDFQAADDKGEVARNKVLLETVKGAVWGEKKRYGEQPAVVTPSTQNILTANADWSQAQLPADSEWAMIE